jgi:hypothetical protein
MNASAVTLEECTAGVLQAADAIAWSWVLLGVAVGAAGAVLGLQLLAHVVMAHRRKRAHPCL